jgi:hypothetical protein
MLPLSYVDNFELLCDRIPDLDASASQLDRFCHLLDLQVDKACLYAWSSESAGRRELKHKGYKISLGNRDLGGQVTYCKQLRNQVMTDRSASIHPLFDKLRKSNLPVGVKKLNIQQCLLPRAFRQAAGRSNACNDLESCWCLTAGKNFVAGIEAGPRMASTFSFCQDVQTPMPIESDCSGLAEALLYC